MYKLYPPFFIVNEESNFADGWEVFCCKLLNADNNTSSIVRRLPPENGVDLFYTGSKIAYQCKSVENGQTSGFNLTKIKQSYQSALNVKKSLGWETYTVCINTELTGAQQENFAKELPGVGLLTKSYWENLCAKFPLLIHGNFRRLMPIEAQPFEAKIQNNFANFYSKKLKNLLQSGSFDLLFYSNKHNTLYTLPVSKYFIISDLITIFRKVFNLPKPTRSSEGVEVSLAYSIVEGDRKVPLDITLEEARIDHKSIITFWLTMRYSKGSKRAMSGTMQMLTFEMMQRALNPVKYALKDYELEIAQSFKKVDEALLGKNIIDDQEQVIRERMLR